MKLFSFRLKPGRDLKLEIEKFAKIKSIKAGFIITCVGSLSEVTMRMAGASPDKQDIREFKGDYEIVSLVGTIAENGFHLHLAISNKDGVVLGGHLKEGSIVSTTAEIVIGEDEDKTFTRRMDPDTGFEELYT
jgi:uncharacterized protein